MWPMYIHGKMYITAVSVKELLHLKKKKKNLRLLLAGGGESMQEAPRCARSICSGNV